MATKTPKDTGAALALIVDEIGDLDRELAPHRTKIARLDNLRKKLRDLYNAQPEGSTFTADGERFAIEVGARGYQTVVNIAKLFKSVKLAVFLRIVSVTLKALNEVCEPAIAASVLTETQTGHRSLQITAKGKAAAEGAD